MPGLVVGVFDSEELALGAVQALRAAGLPRRGVVVLSSNGLGEPALGRLASALRGQRLEGRGEGLLRPLLWGALLGSAVVEVPVLAWLFLGVDHQTAAAVGMSLASLRLLVASTVWKLGTVVGGFVGTAVALERGVDADALRRYEEHLARGDLVVAARVSPRGVRNARGIFIESGALEVRDVSGSFAVQQHRGAAHRA